MAIGGIKDKMNHRRTQNCRGPSVVQSVPDHGEVLPVGFGCCGGALA